MAKEEESRFIGIKEQIAKEQAMAATTATATMEAMPIGVIVHDLEGKILQANAASEKMFGYKREEAIGKSVIDFIAKEDRPRALESMLKGIRESFTRDFECIGIRKDGSKIHILIDSTLVRDAEGNPNSVVISVRDITELKKLMNELEEERTRLEEFVKERTAELEDSYKELQATQSQLIQSEKLAFAGRMAAGVAHEIRNPLSIMTIAMQSLEKTVETVAPHSPEKEYINVVMKSIKRVSNLLDELVNVARPPKLKMRFEDIHRFLDRVIVSTKGKFEAQNIEIIKDFDFELPTLMLDEEHLERAFVNISFNAIEAMPEGGKFTVSTKKEENYAKIEFVDTGVGIAEADIINIFDPFFSKKKGGAGLGLAITLGIIHSHGGAIEVRSTKGRGSTFIVRLPVRKYKKESK